MADTKYTVQDLQDNLDYLAETKDKIKSAIIEKGQPISDNDTFRSYADKIKDISTGEDLEAELSAQEQVIQQMKIALANKTAGREIKLNVYCQETEPENKNGIWLKTNKSYNNIISTISNLSTESLDDIQYSNLLASQDYCNSCYAEDGKIYHMGYCSTNLYVFDTATNTDSIFCSISFATSLTQMCYCSGYLYFVYSIYDGKNYGGINMFKRVNLTTKETESLANIPNGNGNNATFTYNNEVYVQVDGTLYKYNADNNSFIRVNTNSPMQTEGTTAIVVGNEVYYLGTGSSDSSTKNIVKYNFNTQIWTTLNATMGYYEGATLYDNYIYMFKDTTVYKYNIVTDTLETLTLPRTVGTGGSLCTIDNKLYRLSGNTVYTYTINETVYELNTAVIKVSLPKYFTNIVNDTNVKLLFGFNDMVLYDTEDGYIRDIPTYYGDGTQWVKFKN